MFDKLRQSLEDMINRATRPEDRREIAYRMRETLVQAKVGLSEMREGVEKSRKRLEAERAELATIQRRSKLAADIGDAETVAVAAKYEAMQAEKVAVLERKFEAQESELALAERDVAAMTAELKSAMLGAGPPAGAEERAAAEALEEELRPGSGAASEIDALARARARATAEDDAARRLEELKRRMGK